MNESSVPVAVIVSLQVQSSWQSVPLGAACIASSLRSDPRTAKRLATVLLDFSLEGDDFVGLDTDSAGAMVARSILEASNGTPFMAAFSVYVWNRPVLESAAAHLARLSPETFLVAGGPEVTAAPDSFSGINHLIAGEGEAAIVDLALSLLDQKPIPAPIAARRRVAVPDLATLSSPWLDGTLDSCEAGSVHRGALWELARGCPYSCAYCYESLGEKRVRPVPLPRLEAELEHFAASGIERVFVLDPTYNAARERALSLLSLIEKKGKDMHFHFEVRAELLDRELVTAFSRIPCSLQIGLQSANPEALAAVNRPTDLKQFSRKIGLLNDAGIVFGLDLMYGLPGDSLASFRSSLDYAIALYPNNLEIFRLSVLPGTALFVKRDALGIESDPRPPYLTRSTPKFPRVDLDRAETLASACEVFYTHGRAVTWFLSLIKPLKLKPSQFFADFAAWIAAGNSKTAPEVSDVTALASLRLPHAEVERLQIAFTEHKLAEKGKTYLFPAIRDIIAFNGAWTRALAEGEETVLSLSFHPEDLSSADAMDPEYFSENAYMEHSEVRVFSGPEGPDLEFL